MWKTQVVVKDQLADVESEAKMSVCCVIRTSGCEFDTDEITATLNRMFFDFHEDVK